MPALEQNVEAGYSQVSSQTVKGLPWIIPDSAEGKVGETVNILV